MPETRQFNYANFARSTLLSGLGVSDTEMFVQELDAGKFPNADATYDEIFSIILSAPGVEEVEIVYVTATGTNQFSIERGKEGSTAVAWPAGTSVVQNITAQLFTDIVDAGPRAIPRLVGVANGLFDTDKVIIYSDDGGVTWVAVVAPTTDDPTGVTYSLEDKLFVAVGDDGMCWTSIDGETWVDRTSLTPDATTDWDGIDYSPTLGIYVSVSGNGAQRAMWTTNPATTAWTLVDSADNSEQWRRPYWSDLFSKFFSGVSFDADRVMESSDGKTWSLTAAVGNSAGPTDWAEDPVAGRLVGSSGGDTDLLYTDDGSVWNLDLALTQAWNCQVYAPDLDVWILSGSIDSAISNDGITISLHDASFGGKRSMIWSTEFSRIIALPAIISGVAGYSADGLTLISATTFPFDADSVNWVGLIEGYYF